jgi:hypothetical protein
MILITKIKNKIYGNIKPRVFSIFLRNSLVFILLFNLFSSGISNERDTLIEITKEVCKCYQEKDIEKLMSFWSKNSPDYKKTKEDLKREFKNVENVKINFSYKDSPDVLIKKNEAKVIVQNKIIANYIVRYPYKTEGDKINFIFKKNKKGEWKISKITFIKSKKRKEKFFLVKKPKEKKKQKFKTKEEEEIFQLAKNAIECISKRDINCFLKYSDCSFLGGYFHCLKSKIIFKTIEKGFKEEEIKIRIDEDKKISLLVKRDRAEVSIPTITEGKYKLIYPFKLHQTMNVTFKKEKNNWKIWQIKNIDKPIEKDEHKKHKK